MMNGVMITKDGAILTAVLAMLPVKNPVLIKRRIYAMMALLRMGRLPERSIFL